MSSAGTLDIRLPIGGLFTVLGLVLVGYGLATAGQAEHYAPSLGVNIDLWWGLVMLLFGLVMLAAGIRGRGRAEAHPAAESAEGQAVEAREHRLGLEDEGR